MSTSMPPTHNEIKKQLEGLGKRQQYKLLLTTKEWIAFRDRIILLDSSKCQHCGQNEGPVWREIRSFEEYTKMCNEIREYNNNLQKVWKTGEIDTFQQLLNETYQGLMPEPARYEVARHVTLQIHHKLYFNDKLPWEYPRKNVATLCVDCHKEVHRNTKIYTYRDESMQQRKEIPVCSKCSESGYIPEYSHIEYGICFDCNGAGLLFEDITWA